MNSSLVPVKATGPGMGGYTGRLSHILRPEGRFWVHLIYNKNEVFLKYTL